MRALVLALLLAAPPATQPEELRVVTAVGVRVRAAADPAAEVVERLGLGKVVPCLERAGEATVADRKGPFCRTRLADGRQGWFFEPLTRPFDPARPDEAWSAIVAERGEDFGAGQQGRENLWGYHRFLLDRVAEAKEPAVRARWELLELKLVRDQAAAFLGGDPRVYRDEAQGPRLKRQAIWDFVDRSRGTPSSEEGAWMAVEHGHDFECEGYTPCYLAWHENIECEYLKRFPEGPHAGEACRRIAASADEAAAAAKKGELDAEAAGDVARSAAALGRCLEKVKGAEADAARKALESAAAAARGVPRR